MDLNKLFERVSSTIYKNEDFLIATHTFPDGDALGSLVAVYELMRSLKKNAFMICNSEIPYQYKFLPYNDKIKRNLDCIDLSNKRYISICLDSADESRVNLNFKKLRENSKKIINIDHHLSNTNFGDINIVGKEKSATAEIIYRLLIRDFEKCLNHNIALGLYVGILTDTGKFQYFNTSAEVHKIVSHLLEYDIKPYRIFSNIYEREPFNRFKLLQLVLKRVKLLESERLVYSYVLQKDFSKLSLPFSSHDGMIELIRSTKDAKISAFFRQAGNKKFKVSLRSSDNSINVATVAGAFGGGGHRLASAYTVNGVLKKVISDLINNIKNKT